MEYKVGDVVILKGREDGRILNWAEQMYTYSGKPITIDKIISYEGWNGAKNVIQSSELPTDYEWEFRHIKCKVENLEEYLAEKAKREEEERLEREEKLKNVISKPDDVYNLAVSVFGEEFVYLKKLSNDQFDIIVHFPEINISNSREHRHTIKDIYVKFICPKLRIDDSSVSMNIYMRGIRGQCSLKEWESQYGHSHLCVVFDWGDFCLGNSVFYTLIADLRQSLTEEAWLLVFYSLENYLIWESLEGGPHRKMEFMKYNNSGDNVDLNSELFSFVGNIPYSSFSYTDGLQLVETEELNGFYNIYSKTKKLNGYSKEQAEERVKSINRELNKTIEFKDKIVKCRVELNDTFDESYISREVIDRYNQILKERLNLYNKNLQYDHLKHSRKEIMFGKAGII